MGFKASSQLSERVVAYLQSSGGKATPLEICREVFGITNCTVAAAGRIVCGGLVADGRFRVSGDGEVILISPPDAPADLPISSLRCAVVDVETTGLQAARHRVTEVAVVLVESGEIADAFSSLINPGIPIPQQIAAMTGITDEMVAGAPPFGEIASPLLEAIGDRVLVAHNSPFDMGFLNAELERSLSVVIMNPSLCTVRLSRALLPGLDSHRLDSVAGYFDVEIEARHRALGDAQATARVFTKLCGIAEDRGWTKLGQLIDVAGDRLSGPRRQRKPGAGIRGSRTKNDALPEGGG